MSPTCWQLAANQHQALQHVALLQPARRLQQHLFELRGADSMARQIKVHGSQICVVNGVNVWANGAQRDQAQQDLHVRRLGSLWETESRAT